MLDRDQRIIAVIQSLREGEVVSYGDIAADDEKAIFGPTDGPVQVVVDAASSQLLEGATLDYKDGLNQAGFAITNPNATRSCGCGQSFS